MCIRDRNNSDLATMEEEFDISADYAGTRIGAPLGEKELIEEVNTILEDVNEQGLYEQWYEEAIELNNNMTSITATSFLGTLVQIVQSLSLIHIWPSTIWASVCGRWQRSISRMHAWRSSKISAERIACCLFITTCKK